jgi:magnesium-transporting ATPase (P-type)
MSPQRTHQTQYNDALLHARAHCFITLCMMHLWQAFMSRSVTVSIFRQNLFNNKYLVLGCSVSVVLLIICMYIPGWNTAFDQYPLDGYDWIIIIACLVFQTAFVEGIKFLLRRNFFMEERKALPGEKLWYSNI